MVTETANRTSNVEPVVDANLKRLKHVTGQIVGSVFYGTLLHTMRESKLKGAYGHGGRGEEVFAAQLDGVLAERLGSAPGNALRDTLYRHLERQEAGIIRAQLAAGGTER